MHALLLSLALAAPALPSATAASIVAQQAEGAVVQTMSLDEAFAAMEANNPDLQTMAAAIDDADAAAQASLAAVKPMVTLSTTYTLNNEEALLDMGEAFAGIGQALEQATGQPANLGDTGGATTIQPLQSLTASAQVQVPLFAANAYADIKAARVSVDSSKANRESLEIQLRGALRNAAWLAGAAASFVNVSEQAVGNAAAHAERTERLVEAGRATRLSLNQAKLQVLQRKNDLLSAKAELAKAQLAMGVLIGVDGPVAITLPDVAPAVSIPPAGDAVAQGLRDRPEIAAKRSDEKAARLRVRSARMAYLPTLMGTFGGNASTADYVTGLNYAWQAGLTLSWNAYVGGSRRASKKRAEAGLRMARAERHRQELTVRQEVLDARRELELARAKYRLAVEEVAVARDAAASAERTFAEGQSSSLDVLDALDNAFSAELRREQAKAQAAAAAVQLDTARGLR
ncbi:MAG: TolC family protein [Myxococcota bacterium]